MPQRSGQLSAPSGDRGHVHGVTRRRGVAGTYGHRGSWHTAPGKPDASCPKQACFMIVARNGQITSGTGHDHEQRPRCLKVKSRHNGIALRPAAGATRRRRSRPQRGPGQQQSPEIRHHGPLEFLPLRRTRPGAHPPQTGTLVLARNDSLRRRGGTLSRSPQISLGFAWLTRLVVRPAAGTRPGGTKGGAKGRDRGRVFENGSNGVASKGGRYGRIRTGYQVSGRADYR